jgi:hypothetical protein
MESVNVIRYSAIAKHSYPQAPHPLGELHLYGAENGKNMSRKEESAYLSTLLTSRT